MHEDTFTDFFRDILENDKEYRIVQLILNGMDNENIIDLLIEEDLADDKL